MVLVLVCCVTAPAWGIDHVATLTDPDMFGSGWYSATTGLNLENGSGWISQQDPWALAGELRLDTLFGVPSMPKVDDWAWFGMKINRGDQSAGGYFHLFTEPGSDPLLIDDDASYQRIMTMMPDIYDNYSADRSGGIYEIDDWGWRSTDGRGPDGLPLRPDGTPAEPLEFWSLPHAGEADHRPDLAQIQSADYTDLWDNSGWEESWQGPNDSTTWNYGEQKIRSLRLHNARSSARTAGIDTFKWIMNNGDTYTIHFDAPSAPPAAELDRGHRILIDHGLQIQAMTYGTTDPNWWTHGDADGSYWEQSNFTAASFQSRKPRHQNRPEGLPWASWRTVISPTSPHRDDLISWCYSDEQDMNDPAVRAAAKAWIDVERPRLPDTLLYTNQWGTQVTMANMRTYLQEVQPDMLYFDNYPYRADVNPWHPPPMHGTPWSLYKDMVKYRDLGLGGHDGTGNNPIPYGMYLQTFEMDSPTENYPYVLPSESEARQNQFVAWTMGYKHLTAFVYDDVWEIQDVRYVDALLFDPPVLSTANPSAAFDWYVELNRQSLNLGPTLVRLLSTDVRIIPGDRWIAAGQNISHLTDIPQWQAGADGYITNITVQNPGPVIGGQTGDVMIGYFAPLRETFDGPAFENETYFMVTNALAEPNVTAAQALQQITIDFDFGSSGITALQRLSRDTGLVEIVPLESLGGSLYRLALDLAGGTGDLFKFATGAPWVPGPILGDVNWDGMVGVSDLGVMASQWGTAGSGPFNADIAPYGAPDGIVGVGDLGVLAANWDPGSGASVGAATVIPAPFAGAAGGVLLVAASMRRQRGATGYV